MSEEITTTTYVALLHHGGPYPAETTGIQEHRDVRYEAKNAANSVYAFYYFDIVRTWVQVDGEEVETASERLNLSRRYYIDAQVLDRAAAEDLPGDHRILLHYLDCVGGKVIRCRTGNFVPYETERDELIGGS